MASFDSAVLAARDADGVPWLLRVRPELDRTGVFRLDVPAGEPVEPGPASLLCHFHDEQLWNMRSVVVVGELARHERSWHFSATRVVPGASTNPVRMIQTVAGCRRSARQYLERRRLTSPPVDWAAYDSLKSQLKPHGAATASGPS